MSLPALYSVLVAPHSAKAETQSREITLNILLLGTLTLALFATAIVAFNLFVKQQDYHGLRLALCMGVSGFVFGLYISSRKGRLKVASYLFVLMYLLAFVALVAVWSIQIPQGILLAAFVIILSGILLGSRHALYAAVLNTVLLLLAQFYTQPDISWKQTPPEIGDVIVFGVTFALIATVCWLYNSQIEKFLDRAERSEAALRKQKDLLEVKVEQRTRKLQAVQLEQIQQVYRFAELGMVSTALLHDLANHLSSVSLDIEGLEGENNSQIMGRVRRTIGYIDSSVQKTRDQLQGQEKSKKFVVADALDEALSILKYRAQQKKVKVEVASGLASSVRLHGDETRFKQMVTNIIGNGIDAAGDMKQLGRKRTEVWVDSGHGKIIIEVTDYGRGIAPEKLDHLFEPFYTTKKQGMGLGLFMAKQIAEDVFGGQISVRSDVGKGTIFTISLPLKRP